MADTATPDRARTPGDVAPEERGRLDLADRAVERLAVHAATQVAGVVVQRDALHAVTRRSLPRVRVEVSGRIAAADMDLAVAWGAALPEVTATVRDSVREKLQSLAGLDVTRVNVTVQRIVRDDSSSHRRVQ